MSRRMAELTLDGRLEDLARRWVIPNCPEFELGLYRRLFAAELRAELARLAGAKTAERLARRGRVRRLLGDPGGEADLRAALDLEPANADALTWLGEAGLGSRDALAALDRAVAAEPKHGWARAYRGAGRLLARDGRGAAADLEAARKLLPKAALPALLLGRALAALGRKDAADRAYAAALALEPSCSAAALLRARLWTGRRAAAAAEDALDAEPDHAHVALFTWEPERSWEGWLSRHGAFCLEDERELPLCQRFGLEETRFSPYPQEAVARAARALRERGERAWTLAVYGRALARVPGASPETRAEALRFLDRAVKARPQAGWTWGWRALGRMHADPKGALSDLDECLARSPHYFRAYSWRGGLLRRLDRLEDSLRDLDRSAAGDERYPFSAHERSLTRRALGDFAGAALDLDRAYGLDPRYSWVYTPGREGTAKELEEGLKELTDAAARHPSVVSLIAWRGDLLRRAGRLGEALHSLQSAADQDPNHALAQGFLGQALLDAGRAREAAERFARAAALDGRQLPFRAGLADALRRDGRAAEADASLARALAERPRAWTLRLQRARWLLEDGKAARALAEARRAASLEGRDADGWFLEARALAALRRWREAASAVERALEIAPNLGRALLLRGIIRRALGRADEAVADFGLALTRFPHLFNDEERARAGALLQR